MGIDSLDLPYLPEEDHYLYNTTRYGEPRLTSSQVCCDFACSVLKAAGVFGEVDFNCNEFSPHDVAKLKIYQ